MEKRIVGKLLVIAGVLLSSSGCDAVRDQAATAGDQAIAPTNEAAFAPAEALPSAFTVSLKREPAPTPYVPVAPEVAAAVPTELDLPPDFSPPKGGKRQGLGVRRMNGVALEPQHGVHPLCVTECLEGTFGNDLLVVGDVIVAVNGSPLGKNPARQFSDAVRAALKDTGVFWATRWRNGAMTRLLIDLGRRPLDLTKVPQPGLNRDWRLGPLGANGWCFHERTNHGASRKASQMIVTAVDADGPAAGALKVNDVIVGANGARFTYDVRKALAAAINEAEKEANAGRLRLQVWRKGAPQEVTVTLPVMGTYSETAPFDCPKTEKIIDNAVAYILHHRDQLLKPEGWINYINGLGLLAAGREEVMPAVTALARGSMLKEGETLSVEKHVAMMCWWWSYKTVFLCEYYLRTGDDAVLPTIDEHATKIAMGQSGAGTWGHTYAARENTGYLHGHLGGYGAINQQGLTLMVALPLAAKCGIRNKEVMDAIKRGDDFFSYFIGRGTIPYGDHGAAKEWFDDNGKSGAAAVFFDLMGNPEGTRFSSEMVLASTPSGRESGHTGHFWSHLWGGIGAARGGDKALQLFMKVMDPIFTLERQPDGRFAFQDNAGESGKLGDPKTKWDCTGARLLQLCFPSRRLYCTGRETPRETHLTQQRVDQLLWAGQLDVSREARDAVSLDEAFTLLEAPLPPTRAVGARILAEREINAVDRLITMLDSDNRYARYGAAEALCKAGFGSQEAAEKLIRMMDASDDVTFQTYAIDALINRDRQRGLLTAARPAIPVLLRMALQHSPGDPRRVLQHDIARALFYTGRAQPRRGLLPEYGLDGVDRSLLVPVIREILANNNGAARSVMSAWIYDKLTPEERHQVWGDVYLSARYIAPSGIMFASGNRLNGLHLMADGRIAEGLDLAVWYIRHQKGHGASGRVPQALAAILKYGAHAKRIIPKLEEHIVHFESRRNPRKKEIPPDDPANRIRDAIRKIKAMPEPPPFDLVSAAAQIEAASKTHPEAQR